MLFSCIINLKKIKKSLIMINSLYNYYYYLTGPSVAYSSPKDFPKSEGFAEGEKNVSTLEGATEVFNTSLQFDSEYLAKTRTVVEYHPFISSLFACSLYQIFTNLSISSDSVCIATTGCVPIARTIDIVGQWTFLLFIIGNCLETLKDTSKRKKNHVWHDVSIYCMSSDERKDDKLLKMQIWLKVSNEFFEKIFQEIRKIQSNTEAFETINKCKNYLDLYNPFEVYKRELLEEQSDTTNQRSLYNQRWSQFYRPMKQVSKHIAKIESTIKDLNQKMITIESAQKSITKHWMVVRDIFGQLTLDHRPIKDKVTALLE